MLEIRKKDRLFIVFGSIIWGVVIVVTTLDFIFIQLPTYHFDIIVFIGVVLVLAGTTIRQIAKRTLGRSYTYTLKTLENQKLIKTGIYRFIRHPGYIGTLIADLGIPLLFHSLYGFLVVLLLIPLFVYRMGVEEKMMIMKFGDEYRDYMKHTCRLIPHVY
ncbi:MAG: isoprenylcysteine carboxylmethyltransferase family protein [Firmicutes bacterium]|nr:isoprenylcysteine carboxylmethyltransferase family protein [Bacillota bacterium]